MAALVAIDGSKYKVVKTREQNFPAYKVKRRIEQVAEQIAGYLQDLDTADRKESEAAEARSVQLASRMIEAPRGRSSGSDHQMAAALSARGTQGPATCTAARLPAKLRAPIIWPSVPGGLANWATLSTTALPGHDYGPPVGPCQSLVA